MDELESDLSITRQERHSMKRFHLLSKGNHLLATIRAQVAIESSDLYDTRHCK